MSVCLCNLSADTILELAAQHELELEPASPNPADFEADPIVAERVLGNLAERLSKPIELMVDDAKKRRRALGIYSHAWKGKLTRSSVFALGDGLYVTSPELTLLQQASQVHQASLCQMLGRYMGTWTPNPNRPTGQDKRAPLTTPELLNGFLKEVGVERGQSNLRLALAYTCEGAASFGETSLQLALCLPAELHGLGIVQPTMNYEVGLSSETQRLYPRESIRIDLCWRQKAFGLEYQGKEHGNQLGEDYARWLAARNEGYEYWFVANEQLNSAAQMKYLGHEVARRIGCDMDEGLWPSDEELQDLLDILAGRKHPKPIGSNELRRRRAKARAWRKASL